MVVVCLKPNNAFAVDPQRGAMTWPIPRNELKAPEAMLPTSRFCDGNQISADSIISGRPGISCIARQKPTRAQPIPMTTSESPKWSSSEGPTQRKPMQNITEASIIRTRLSIFLGMYCTRMLNGMQKHGNIAKNRPICIVFNPFSTSRGATIGSIWQ